MAIALPNAVDVRAFVRRTLHPRSKLGKTTLWFGYLAIALQILRLSLQLILRSTPGAFVSGWASFLTFLFAGFAMLMGLRWVRHRMLWRLRNRLIVTYMFIGVIPVILLVAMAWVAGWLFAGQFATYVASSELQLRLQHLEAANRSLATQLRTLVRDNRLNSQSAGEIANASSERLRHRTVSVWDNGKGFLLVGDPGRSAPDVPIDASPAMYDDFAGFVLDNGRLHLRAVKRLDQGDHHLTVISDMPITPELLRPATAQLGEVSLLAPEPPQKSPTAVPPGASPGQKKQRTPDPDYNDGNAGNGRKQPGNVQAGSLPAPVNWFDWHIPFVTRFDVVDWPSGKTLTGPMIVDTRVSMIYATLFSTLGDKAGIFRDMLIGIAIFFAVVELIALIIGVRLTRSMTKSVAELYSATQYVNRGELNHQIAVRSNDQMAALEQSFNSMTRSLSKLIAEQKEKQRMESELAIAHEVQALLFPADLSGLRGLEVHGVCRPARTVSGDYYDFIPLSDQSLMIAVGDISGKGISAALLMATVHAFVRAYSLELERTMASVALSARAPAGNFAGFIAAGDGDGDSQFSPGPLMATLNYQLYRSTPPEKYATMFLGAYDAMSRTLTYSNAGHLPPLLLARDGEVRRLETSGTVVGLFDGMSYDESGVAMAPGEIFVAYSDGITEPENEFGEFGEERLIDLILQHRDQPLSRISEIVTTAVSDWIAGGEQPDDVTLVLARAR
jgi:phosphoserine phosphatase RsbU/P